MHEKSNKKSYNNLKHYTIKFVIWLTKSNETDQHIVSIDRDFDNLILYLWKCIKIWFVIKLEYIFLIQYFTLWHILIHSQVIIYNQMVFQI